MIQRLQTVFLALVALFNSVYAITPLCKKVLEDPSAWLSSTHIAALVFSAVVSVYVIFLFKNREKQIQLTKLALVFQAIAIGSALGVLFSLGGIGTYLWDELLSWVVLFAVLVSQLLAIKYISKDINLVKSMDRIR